MEKTRIELMVDVIKELAAKRKHPNVRYIKRKMIEKANNEKMSMDILTGTKENESDNSETTNYYIVNKLDKEANFFLINKEEIDVIDFVMSLPDGDLANYEIYEQII